MTKDDIEDAFRIAQGKTILLSRFKSAGRNSVRDRLYDSRVRLQLPRLTDGSAEQPKIFVWRNLSPYRQIIYKAPVKEKQAKIYIYSVFTQR